VLPGNEGNTFLFAHSSDNFYASSRYNTVFYLLNKLAVQDNFYITHDGSIYEYRVYEKRIVTPDAVEYLQATSQKNTAILMTCWPAGTTSKRLLVMGVLSAVSKSGEMDISQ
jgi:LPXTG-site transpeptidase (sortase) family protein